MHETLQIFPFLNLVFTIGLKSFSVQKPKTNKTLKIGTPYQGGILFYLFQERQDMSLENYMVSLLLQMINHQKLNGAVLVLKLKELKLL